jgi:hypothetical protein
MEKTNKANFMVVIKLRDQITTIVEAEDVASARDNALKHLEQYLTSTNSITACLRNNDKSKDMEVIHLPKPMFIPQG